MIRVEKTLSEVMTVLNRQGYTQDYNLLHVPNSCLDVKDKMSLKHLVITGIHRFSGQNDAADEAILYAIHNIKNGAKGILVNGYGIYTDEHATAIIEKISMNAIGPLINLK